MMRKNERNKDDKETKGKKMKVNPELRDQGGERKRIKEDDKEEEDGGPHRLIHRIREESIHRKRNRH